MEQKSIETKIMEIENENDIQLKYENITKLHKIIDKEEKKLENLNDKIERNTKSKYDDMDLDKIISKFNKTDNIEKKIKYYHSISNKIDEIINTINN
tara:strand:+ start:2523 stop:2813 length:291 start_codon:yes stop_codon:yes gene_type:complete